MTNSLVLCVDDDQDDIEILSEALKEVKPDIDIAVAINGLKAIELLEEMKVKKHKTPCVIIMDINMPVLNGKQTFQQIKKDPFFNNVPVFFFTSSSNPDEKKLLSKWGAEMFTKPSKASSFKALAEKFLSHCI